MYLLNQSMQKRKMKIIGLVALFILCNSMTFTDVNAATTTNKGTKKQSVSTKETKVQVKNSTLAIRKGAGIKYQSLTKVKKGTTLTALGNVKSVWVKVEYKGKIGYVYNKDSKYLKEASSVSAEDIAIKKVIQAINKISDTLTIDDKEQVTKAREAYNKLSSSAKKKVTNISKLKKAEEKISSLEVLDDKVEEAIPSINGDNTNTEVVIPSTGGNNNVVVDIPSSSGGNNNTTVENPANSGGNNNTTVENPTIGGGNNNSVVENPSNNGGNNITEAITPSHDAIKEKAQEITDKISKLNKEITLLDKEYIESVRKEYTEAQEAVKKLIANVEILETAEHKIQVLLNEQKLADIVIARIEELNKEITLADTAIIAEIREDYESLPTGSKDLVYNIGVLKNAETKIENLKSEYENAEKSVLKYRSELEKLPQVEQIKLSDKDAVAGVRTLFEQLNEIAKTLISQEENQKLIVLEERIKELEIKEQDKVNAAYVEELIQSLEKTIAYQDYALIREARKEYNNLSIYGKSLVSNLETLKNAEIAHAEVLEKVSNVLNLINKIPEELTLKDKPSVVSAREAYDKLLPDEKTAITKWELSILVFSEEKMERLETIEKHEVLINFSNQVKALPNKENISIKDYERIIELKDQYYLIEENLRFAVGEEFTVLCELEAQIKFLEGNNTIL